MNKVYVNKGALVSAVQVTVDTKVLTPNGTRVAKPTDWIVENYKEQKYIVPSNLFKELYVPVKQEQETIFKRILRGV